MKISKGVQLVDDFVERLRLITDNIITKTDISKNVFLYNGDSDCLLYIKGRSEKPYRWGVTANVIDRLRHQEKRWFVVLLFESPEKGYIIKSEDVADYIDRNVWPLARDGDYKPSTGAYLALNREHYSIKEAIEIIERSNG